MNENDRTDGITLDTTGFEPSSTGRGIKRYRTNRRTTIDKWTQSVENRNLGTVNHLRGHRHRLAGQSRSQRDGHGRP